MAVEIHVACEVEGCSATERVESANNDNFDFSSCTDVLRDGTFHFFVDSGWINAPKGWTLVDDEMRCPAHGESEASRG